MKYLNMDGKSLSNLDSFHDHFASTFGFPSYYGRNMNAWNDCMSDYCLAHGLVSLHIENVKVFRDQAPQLFEALLDCSAFINWRSTKDGGHPMIALSYFT